MRDGPRERPIQEPVRAPTPVVPRRGVADQIARMVALESRGEVRVQKQLLIVRQFEAVGQRALDHQRVVIGAEGRVGIAELAGYLGSEVQILRLADLVFIACFAVVVLQDVEAHERIG